MTSWPVAGEVDAEILQDFDLLKEIVGGVRNIRKDNGICEPRKTTTQVASERTVILDRIKTSVEHLTNLDSTDGCG